MRWAQAHQNWTVERNDKKTTLNIEFINPKSTINESGYQQFSKLKRFSNNKKFVYKRIFFQPQAKSKQIIDKNIRSASNANYRNKLKKISCNSKILKQRINSAQINKKRIIEDENERIYNLEKYKERIRLLKKERKNYGKIAKNWIMFYSLIGLINKFIIRKIAYKSSKIKIAKMLGCVYYCLLFIGKLIKILSSLRKVKACLIIKRVSVVYSKRWKMKVRNNLKIRLGNFYMKYNKTICRKYLFMKVSKCILFIQRIIKRYLIKKRIMLGIMNEQW